MNENDNKKPEKAPQEKAPQAEAKLSLTLSELKELMTTAVATAVAQSSETSAKMIAEAMLEARKPYVDPRQVENEQKMRESMRAVQDRIQRDIRASQDSCPHLQGSNALSDFQGQLTSIVQHNLDTGEVVGICTNCQRIFRNTDNDYRKEMARKSGNRMSSAGQRFFTNPLAAQRAGKL